MSQTSGPAAPVQQELAGMPQPLYSASPSRLLTWLDCPRRYRMAYLDRPRPAARPQRAHTSFGVAVHNALRDFWDLAPVDRSPSAAARLVRGAWIDLGFRSRAVRPVARPRADPGRVVPPGGRPARRAAGH